jgi:ABC-type nitrate/sulfonate/bicarbonate transport system substrate-binding protein
MKRIALVLIACVMVVAIAGCRSSEPKTATTGASTPATTGLAPGDENRPWKTVNRDRIYLTPSKTYDAANFPKTAMTGAPSNIPFFKPTKDEGILDRNYPAYDNKTFKFLVNMSECLVPQWYYVFGKNGGTLNPAVAKTGFKFAYLLDGGHNKMLPNLMLGYYDFAWIPANQMTELWSGQEMQNQELWRGGDDYVVIGASYDAGVDLLAEPGITDVKQLAGKTVGIMNVSYYSEALLNKALTRVGLATESAGGNVKVEMATPGFIMNNLTTKRDAASFVWTKYAAEVKSRGGFTTLMKWQDMGYGTKMPAVWLVVRRDIIEKHPDVVQAVVQANYDATKAAASSSDYKAPSDAAYNAYWQKYYGATPNIVDPPQSQIDAQANPAYLRDIIAYMTKCGYFKVPYSYDRLVDDSFYNNVRK